MNNLEIMAEKAEMELRQAKLELPLRQVAYVTSEGRIMTPGRLMQVSLYIERLKKRYGGNIYSSIDSVKKV